MFRLIFLTCLFPLCIGNSIHGQILLDGDANKSVRVASGSTTTISLQDTSLADAAAVMVKQMQVENLFALPFTFEMEIPDDLSSHNTYTLSVRITKGVNLLYINDQQIRVDVSSKNPITQDIPVVRVSQDEIDTAKKVTSNDDAKQTSWPEMVGKEGSYAVQYIKEKTGLTNVFTIGQNSAMTMDYRQDRVRIPVDDNGIVSRTPIIA
ncbi:unnamed protein product [Adineta ricciae]|uniref:Uncharacterized protein n=1 Tax=Adineta ricciae TaxID=249248 RepID=A0A815DPN8_ADIRI|nr:unnamed protein product [Adineta ricciae]CAF1300606.1 unnamed protein product [Adineta ricciae]